MIGSNKEIECTCVYMNMMCVYNRYDGVTMERRTQMTARSRTLAKISMVQQQPGERDYIRHEERERMSDVPSQEGWREKREKSGDHG